MLIMDMEQTTESPTLDQFLRSWWARFQAWLRRQPLPEEGADKHTNDRDRAGSLIL